MNEFLYKQFVDEYFDFVSGKCTLVLRGFHTLSLDQITVLHVMHQVFGKLKNSKTMYKLLLEGNQAKIYGFLFTCVRNASIDYGKKYKKNNAIQGVELSDIVLNTPPETKGGDDLQRQIDWKNAMDVFKSMLPQPERDLVDLLLAGHERKDIAQMPGWDKNRYDYGVKKLKKLKYLKGFKNLLGL